MIIVRASVTTALLLASLALLHAGPVGADAFSSSVFQSLMSPTHQELWHAAECCTRGSCAPPSLSAASAQQQLLHVPWHHTSTVDLRVTLQMNPEYAQKDDWALAAAAQELGEILLPDDNTRMETEWRGEKQAPSHTHPIVERNLAMLRKLLAPAPNAVSAATRVLLGRTLDFSSSLADDMPCALQWDTLVCKQLRVVDLLALLPEAVPICRLTPRQPNSDAWPTPPTALVATPLANPALIAALGLSAHVAYITGLSPYDYRSVPNRRKMTIEATTKDAASSSSDQGAEGGRGWPVANSSAPVIVGLSPGSSTDPNFNISVALYCVDGSPSPCSSTLAYEPTTINVSATSNLTGIVSFTTFSPTDCFIDPTLPELYSQVVICTSQITFEQTALASVRFAAQTIFTNSNDTTAPATRHGSNCVRTTMVRTARPLT